MFMGTNFGQRTFLIFPERHMPRRLDSAAAMSASPSLRIALAINRGVFAAELRFFETSGAVVRSSGLMSDLNQPNLAICTGFRAKKTTGGVGKT
jgi:hypothetical protein